ncbi:hypothetical protein MOB18_21460 [Bacillus inaquosorum]|uniref:hypothetical protein n=1 Tax=Bacillus inaquosorum TaxID=483913 RepID=UPI00227F5C95|nr:hypothetical protein [Bacillus inaquosorum]MCY7751632.1 hypothetical protein [Bacillus inaquosorum]
MHPDLVEKVTSRGTRYYESHSGQVIAKACRGCGDVFALTDFRKSQGFAGRSSECNYCKLKRDAEYRTKNKQKRAEYSRAYCSARKEHYAMLKKRWQKKNSISIILQNQKRRAKVKDLPNDLTQADKLKIQDYFGGCALTGKSSNIHWDHVIPLSTGFGGTTKGNMIPLSSELNISKYNSNIFEWFEANKDRFNLSSVKFDNLISYLAKVNCMSVEEYSRYYNSCFNKSQQS